MRLLDWARFQFCIWSFFISALNLCNSAPLLSIILLFKLNQGNKKSFLLHKQKLITFFPILKQKMQWLRFKTEFAHKISPSQTTRLDCNNAHTQFQFKIMEGYFLSARRLIKFVRSCNRIQQQKNERKRRENVI